MGVWTTDTMSGLTEEQRARAEEIRQEYLNYAQGPPESTDQDCRDALSTLRTSLDLPDVPVIMASGPFEGITKANIAAIQDASLDDMDSPARAFDINSVPRDKYDGVRDIIESHVGMTVDGELPVQEVTPEWTCIMFSYWAAFYEALLEFGAECPDDLEDLLWQHKDTISAGILTTFTFDPFVIAVRRPLHIGWDDEGRIHDPDGAAVEFADGFNWYSWHGITVPEDWILDTPDVETVMQVENTEQRRAGIEIIGPQNFAEQADTTVIDEDEDEVGQDRRLVDITIDDVTWRMTHVTDPSTGREYWERVPREFETCREAVAWQYGFDDPDEYDPRVRT